MTDLSGITVTTGILNDQRKDALGEALDRIGGRLIDSVRIDTTHFVCSEGRGPLWEKAVEMNIPVVVPEWVDACEAEGTIVSVRGYYLNADPKTRQLGPIHGSTQHQRTTSSIASPSRPSQSHSQSLSLPASQQEADQSAPEAPPTPFPGADMSGQPKAEDEENDSSKDSETPPPPPPKDEDSEASETRTVASPEDKQEDEPETNGETKLESAPLPTEVSEEEDSKAQDLSEKSDEQDHENGDDEKEEEGEEEKEILPSPKGGETGKSKEHSGESDFNEVPL